MSEDRKARVLKTLSLALGRPLKGDEDLARDRNADWDSLKHIELVLLLEEEFRVRFTASEVAALNSLDSILRRLDGKHAS